MISGNKIGSWLIINERSQGWFAKKIGISAPRLNYWIKNNTEIKEKYKKKVQNIIDTY